MLQWGEVRQSMNILKRPAPSQAMNTIPSLIGQLQWTGHCAVFGRPSPLPDVRSVGQSDGRTVGRVRSVGRWRQQRHRIGRSPGPKGIDRIIRLERTSSM